eukprot:gnl/Hemi2/9418_TR3273_c0_g1_i1.p1 gnl/Hemi2/9418_TR3273_c0_g1~~gnl/Hemi2/9418_TR3273_c0_g1_i1.p1  ORF type:complete len:317 (-),score=102.75 gnl/Hemi2/9418_TR3273_c0_g1_i1:175-1125(-)
MSEKKDVEMSDKKSKGSSSKPGTPKSPAPAHGHGIDDKFAMKSDELGIQFIKECCGGRAITIRSKCGGDVYAAAHAKYDCCCGCCGPYVQAKFNIGEHPHDEQATPDEKPYLDMIYHRAFCFCNESKLEVQRFGEVIGNITSGSNCSWRLCCWCCGYRSMLSLQDPQEREKFTLRKKRDCCCGIPYAIFCCACCEKSDEEKKLEQRSTCAKCGDCCCGYEDLMTWDVFGPSATDDIFTRLRYKHMFGCCGNLFGPGCCMFCNHDNDNFTYVHFTGKHVKDNHNFDEQADRELLLALCVYVHLIGQGPQDSAHVARK